MRGDRALAAAFSLAAAGAHAQLKPMRSMQPMQPMPAFGAPANSDGTFKPYKPWEPPKPFVGHSVYDDGPFSPAAEAKRERKANAAPAGGMYSPEADATREPERAKGFHPY